MYNEETEPGVGIIHFPRGRSRETQKLRPEDLRPEKQACGHECAACGRCHNAHCYRCTVMCATALDAVMYRSSVPEDKPRKKFFGLLKRG